MTRCWFGFLGVALSVLALACDEPAADLAEWTVADHTHQTEKTQRQQRRQATTKAPTYSQPSKRNMLVEVTWMKQCSNCHGKRGKGDGPQSPMVKAKDLTLADWQSSVTDEQILAVIKQGKGKMPAFNLPDNVLADMVAHVRALPARAARFGAPSPNSAAGQQGNAEDDEAAEGGAAPAAGH